MARVVVVVDAGESWYDCVVAVELALNHHHAKMMMTMTLENHSTDSS